MALVRRCIGKTAMRVRTFALNRTYGNRYNNERHLDLMDSMAMFQFGATAKLDDVAKLCGLPESSVWRVMPCHKRLRRAKPMTFAAIVKAMPC